MPPTFYLKRSKMIHRINWIDIVRSIKNQQSSGQLVATTSNNQVVSFEWCFTDILSQELALFKKEVASFAAQKSQEEEIIFLKKFPKAVESEFLLKPCATFFDGSRDTVDWEKVGETIFQSTVMFYQADIKMFGDALKPLLDDIYCCIKAVDPKTKNLLGFLLCAVTPTIRAGTVKIIRVGVGQSVFSGEVELLLVSAVLRLIPQAKELVIAVRPTNQAAIDCYTKWGFVEAKNLTVDAQHQVNTEYFHVMKYVVENSARLLELSVQKLL